MSNVINLAEKKYAALLRKDMLLEISNEVAAAAEITSYDLSCSRSRAEQSKETLGRAREVIDIAWKRVNAINELLKLSAAINGDDASDFDLYRRGIKDYLALCVKELKRLRASCDELR